MSRSLLLISSDLRALSLVFTIGMHLGFCLFVSTWRTCSPTLVSKDNNENLGYLLVPGDTIAGSKPVYLMQASLGWSSLRRMDTTTGTHSFVKFASCIWYAYSHIGARILSTELLGHILCSKESLFHLIVSQFITWIQKSTCVHSWPMCHMGISNRCLSKYC